MSDMNLYFWKEYVRFYYNGHDRQIKMKNLHETIITRDA